MTLNQVTLIGYLVKTPELKQSADGYSVCTFTIGVNRKQTKRSDGDIVSDFFDIVTWSKTAEFVSKYFKKGQPIIVSGSLRQRRWTSNSGEKRYSIEVVANDVGFASEKKTSESSDSYAPSFGDSPISANFEEIGGEDDLPF